MADRILIEDDFSPIQETIELVPMMIEANHARLIDDSIIYEKMALFLFHEFDSKLSQVDDEVYDLLNSNHYKNLDTTESKIEVSESGPVYDSEDFKQYIEHFLEVIEQQNLLNLYVNLSKRELFNAPELFTGELKTNLKTFKVGHLLNNARFNKALKYNLESIEGTESSFIDTFLNSKPIHYDTLKNHITFTNSESSNYITVNSNKYMLELFKQQKLIPKNSDSLESLKVGKVKQSNKVSHFGKANNPIQKLRVENEKVIFEGMFLNKESDDILEIIQALKEIQTKVENLDELNLDIVGSSSNPIKSVIVSALTPKRGKLGLGSIHIKLGLTKKFSGSDLYSKSGIKELSIVNILSSMGFKRARNIPKDPKHRAKLEEENVEVFDYETPKQIKDRVKLETEAEEAGETLEDLPDEHEVLAKFIPLVVISESSLINEWEVDFSITSGTFLNKPKQGQRLADTDERRDRSETSKGKKINLSDISTMGRLKSSYRALERMVDRFG